MTKRKSDPSAALAHLQDQARRLLGDQGDLTQRSALCWIPLADVCETEDRVVVFIELPGVRWGDLELVVERSEISICGVRHTEPGLDSAHYHQVEREFGDFRRTFHFQQQFDTGTAEAVMKDGLLQISVNKADAERS